MALREGIPEKIQPFFSALSKLPLMPPPPLHVIWATLSLLKSVKVDLGREAHPNARKFGNFFTLKKVSKSIWAGVEGANLVNVQKKDCFLFKDSFP